MYYWASLAVIIVAMTGCIVFVADYVRTVDWHDPFAQVVIALNSAIAGVLIITVMRGFAIIAADWWRYVSLGFFVVVDIAIWTQWVLLRRYRHASRDD